MHVAICGPCSPDLLGDRLEKADGARATSYAGIGGVVVAQLTRGLLTAGHRVTVVTTAGSPSEDPASFSGPDLEVIAVPRRKEPRPALADLYRAERRHMAAALRDVAPDIVHAHWTYEFELAAQDTGLPHVTTAHDAPLTVLRQTRDPFRALRLLVAWRARPGIRDLSAVSPYLARRWRTQMQYRRQVTTIPNPLPTDIGGEDRAPAERPTILDVANSGKLKNIPLLLEAFRGVLRAHPDAQLRLVGPGLGDGEPLAAVAAERGLAEGVVFLGELSRPDLDAEYARAWLLVHPSREESFGMSVLEALAAGVPVIAGADAGGVEFVLDGGRAGTLVKGTDPQTWTSAMLAQLRDGPSTTVNSAWLEHFTSAAVTRQYVNWYQDCL